MPHATRRRPQRAIPALVLASIASLLSLAGPPHAEAKKAYDACGPVLHRASGGAWACTFVDNFSGKELDRDKWRIQETWLTGFRTGATCYDDIDNARLRNGKLLLTTRRTDKSFTCVSPAGNYPTRYLGGMITTHSRFAQAFGRFEVRAAFPKATKTGLHGGFWMYPETPAYGEWPKSGEIDVAEWMSVAPRHMYPSLHYAGSTFSDTGRTCTISNISSFHRYTVEWYRTVIRFYYDGRLCFQRSWRPDGDFTGSQPFDRPFNLVLNMGVGDTGNDVNRATWATEAPASLIVDYAKAWR